MAFEIFTDKKGRSAEPTVSLLASGGLFFNSACYNQFFKKHKYLVLLYDAQNSLIGVRPTDKQEAYSYKITVAKSGAGCSISGLSFVKKYKINHSKTRSFKAKWNDAEKLIEIDLKNSPEA